jgi:hypothetical protein
MTNTFTKTLVRSIVAALMLVVLVVGCFAGCASKDAKAAAESALVKLDALQAEIDALQEALGNVTTKAELDAVVATLSSKIEAVNTAIAGLTTNLGDLKDDVKDLGDDLDAVKEQIATNNAAINETLGEIEELINSVVELIEKNKADFESATPGVLEQFFAIDKKQEELSAMRDQYSDESIALLFQICQNTKIQILRATSEENLKSLMDAFYASLDAIPTYVEVLEAKVAAVGTPVSIANEAKVLDMIDAYEECVAANVEVPAALKAEYDAIVARYEELLAAEADADMFVNRVVTQYGASGIKSQSELDELRAYIDSAYPTFHIVTDEAAEGFDSANYAIYAAAEAEYARLAADFAEKMVIVTEKYDAMLAAVEAAGETVNFLSIETVATATGLKAELVALQITEDVILPDGREVKVGYDAVTVLAKKFDDFCAGAASEAATVVNAHNNSPVATDIRNLAAIKAVQAQKDAWVAKYVVDGVTLADIATVSTYTLLTEANVEAIDAKVAAVVAHDAAAQLAAATLVTEINAIVDLWNAGNTDPLTFNFTVVANKIADYLTTYYGASATIVDSLYGVKDVHAAFVTANGEYEAEIAAVKAAFLANVSTKVNAIPAPLALSSKAAIEEARAAYEAWKTEFKVSATPDWAAADVEKIVNAENGYATLKAAYDAAVANLEAQTAALPSTLVLADKAKVDAVVALRTELLANAAYELTASPASNAAVLEAAEAVIAELVALQAQIHNAIDALDVNVADIRTYKTALEAIHADIVVYVEKNLTTDGLHTECLSKLATLDEKLALADVIDRKAANVEALNAYYKAALDEARIAISDPAELAAVEADLAEALAAGVACINDERVNTIKLADAALEAAKELIDEVYTVVGLQ